MTYITVDSTVKPVGTFDTNFSASEIKNEPMLFNCDLEHARTLGGPITRTILESIPSGWKSCPLVIDSRVHMLMLGWYPCIPGWHHDDVPRTRADGQPNYGHDADRSEHLIGLLNAHLAPTEFASGRADFAYPTDGTVLYAKWHEDVELLLVNKFLNLSFAQSGILYQFNDRTWHRGVPAVGTGWRFFIRISRYFDAFSGKNIARKNVRTNEVRKQVQTYLSAVNAGW